MSRSPVLLLPLLLLAAGAAAAEPEAAYLARLRQALSDVRAAQEAPPERARALLEAARERVGPQASVATPEGTIEVDHTRLQTRLREAGQAEEPASAAATERAARLLETMLALAEPGGPAAPAADSEARAALAGVLAGREFAPEPLERLRDWIWDRIASLFEGLVGNRPGEFLRWAAWLVFGGGLLLTGLLLGWLLYVVALRHHTGAGRPETGAAVPAVERRARPETCLAEAEAAARRGDWPAALRLAYRALLLRLDRAGLVPYEPARTNGEVLARLRAAEREPVRALVQPVARSVDAHLYGGREATPADYERCRAACASLEERECAA